MYVVIFRISSDHNSAVVSAMFQEVSVDDYSRGEVKSK